MSNNYVQDNLQQLGAEYQAIIDYTQNLKPNERVKSLLEEANNYREMTFSSSDLADVLKVEPKSAASSMRKLVERYEKECDQWIFQNNSNHKQFTHEQAEDFLKWCGHSSIRLQRELGAKYSVPVVYGTQGKGGVGKTTFNVHMAVAAVMDPTRLCRALIIDRDANQGSVGHLLSSVDDDFEFSSTLPIFEKYAYLPREERLSPEIQAEIREWLLAEFVLESDIPNLFFIPASRDDIHVEKIIAKLLAKGTSEQESYDLAYTIFSDLIIAPLSNDVDIIFLDSSPSISPEKYALLYASKHLILPITPRTLDVKSSANHRSAISDFIEELAPSDFNGWETIVTTFTKCPSSTDYRKRCSDLVGVCDAIPTVMPETKAYEVASEHKRPVQFLKVEHIGGVTAHRKTINEIYSSISSRVFQNVWGDK